MELAEGILKKFTSKKEQPKYQNFAQQRIDQYFKQAGHENYQKHVFTTEDGYKIRFFRIQKKGEPIKPGKKVIYMQHGLLDSSDTWIINQYDKAPGFMFAQRGYDVWLGNTRGNMYSCPQLSPQIKKEQFFNFTFDQMAKFDLPAAFQNIAKITEQKIHYIGHSQGTLIMFIALSQQNPIIQKHIASFSALGPVVFLKNIRTKLAQKLIGIATQGLLKTGRKLFKKLQQWKGYDNFLMPSRISKGLKETVIELKQKALPIAMVFDIQHMSFRQISDEFPEENNVERMTIILNHFPAGTSLNNFFHFIQFGTNGGKFCRYCREDTDDHEYSLKNIRVNVPIHLFVGGGDLLASEKDSQIIMQSLGAKNKKRSVYQKYGHSSFIWGRNTKLCVDQIEDQVINHPAAQK